MLKAAVDSGDIFRSESGRERRSIAELLIPRTVREQLGAPKPKGQERAKDGGDNKNHKPYNGFDVLPGYKRRW